MHPRLQGARAWLQAMPPPPHYSGEEGSFFFEFSRLLKRRGSLRVSSSLPGAPGGQGWREGGKYPLSPPQVPLSRDALPATEDSLCVETEADHSHYARLVGQGSPGMGGDSSVGRPRPGAWRGVSSPSDLCAWSPGRSGPPVPHPHGAIPSQMSFAETELTEVVSPTRRAEPTAGGSAGSLLGRARRGRPGSPWLCSRRCIRSQKTQTAAVSY